MYRSHRDRPRQARPSFHFLIGVPGREIKHYEETEAGLLLSSEDLIGLTHSVGLRPHFYMRGLTGGRGILSA